MFGHTQLVSPSEVTDVEALLPLLQRNVELNPPPGVVQSKVVWFAHIVGKATRNHP